VSPEAVAVQVNALPVVKPEVGHDTVTAAGCPATLMVVEADAVAALLSLATLVTVPVPVLPPHVTVIVLVVEVPLHVAGRVQVNV